MHLDVCALPFAVLGPVGFYQVFNFLTGVALKVTGRTADILRHKVMAQVSRFLRASQQAQPTLAIAYE